MKFTPCYLGIFNVNRVFWAIAQNFSIRRGKYIFHYSLTLQMDYPENILFIFHKFGLDKNNEKKPQQIKISTRYSYIQSFSNSSYWKLFTKYPRAIIRNQQLSANSQETLYEITSFKHLEFILNYLF